MAYPQYPDEPQTQNAFQLLGEGLYKGGGLLGDYSERQDKLRQAMEEMTQRRAAALLAQQQAEREQRKADQEYEFKQAEDERAARFALEALKGEATLPTLAEHPELARGRPRPPAQAQGPSKEEMAWLSDTEGDSLPPQGVKAGPSPTQLMGKALNKIPYEDAENRTPYDREGLAKLGLKHRQLDLDKYLSATKPERQRFSIINSGGRKIKVNLDTNEQEDLGPADSKDRFTKYSSGGRQILHNIDTGEDTDLGPVEPKPQPQRDLATGDIEKLTELANKRDNVHFIVDGFKDDFTGFGTTTQNIFGKVTGTNKEQVRWWQEYSNLVNQIRHGTFGASLTPGEKEEFDKTIVDQNTDPEIAKSYLARQKKVIDDAVERKRQIYLAGEHVNKRQIGAALAPPASEGGEAARKTVWRMGPGGVKHEYYEDTHEPVRKGK